MQSQQHLESNQGSADGSNKRNLSGSAHKENSQITSAERLSAVNPHNLGFDPARNRDALPVAAPGAISANTTTSVPAIAVDNPFTLLDPSKQDVTPTSSMSDDSDDDFGSEDGTEDTAPLRACMLARDSLTVPTSSAHTTLEVLTALRDASLMPHPSRITSITSISIDMSAETAIVVLSYSELVSMPPPDTLSPSNVICCTHLTLPFTAVTVTVTVVTHLLRTPQSDRYGLTISINFGKPQKILADGICHSIPLSTTHTALVHSARQIHPVHSAPPIHPVHSAIHTHTRCTAHHTHNTYVRCITYAKLNLSLYVFHHKDYG